MSPVQKAVGFKQFSGRYAPPFCKCEFPSVQTLTNYRGYIPDLVKCHCGEELIERGARYDQGKFLKTDNRNCEWRWIRESNQNECKNQADDDNRPFTKSSSQESNDSMEITYSDANAFIGNMGKDITFHPVYSQGTSIIRGNKSLDTGKIHYWEVRILTALTGTDVMFGIGTDKVDMDGFQFHFVSGLGRDTHSWGLSYHGRIQHKGIQKKYGHPFTQGSLIGIYLDRSKGYLEFFLNRQSMGIAYRNIPLDPNIKIYPMVCSTVARSCIRLVNATSVKDSLQFRAIQALAKSKPNIISTLREELPGLRHLFSKYWFLIVTKPSLIADMQSLPPLFSTKEYQNKVCGSPIVQTKEPLADKEKQDYLNDCGSVVAITERNLIVKRKKRFCPTLYDISDIADDLCSTSEKISMHPHLRQSLPTSGRISNECTIDCKKSSYQSSNTTSGSGEVFDSCLSTTASTNPTTARSNSYQDYLHYML